MNFSHCLRTNFSICRAIKMPLRNQCSYQKIITNLKLYPTDQCNSAVRSMSTINMKTATQAGFFKNILTKLPVFNMNRSKMLASGYLLYEGVADKLNYGQFFDELELPDTFYSWFVVTELHIWMLSVRVMAESDDDGRLLRNSMVEALWADVTQRVKKLESANPTSARLQIAELSEQFQAALIGYDEGLQTDDRILAGALWRRFYQQQYVCPDCLDILVKYVRKQIKMLDNLSLEQIISNKYVKWDGLAE